MKTIMKKAVLTIVSALLLCGCGDVYRTYETYEIVKQGTDMFVDYIDANLEDWYVVGKEGEPGCFIYQEFCFDEITEDVLNNGAVLVYQIDEDNVYNENKHDNILPYVFPVRNEKGKLIMQNIRFNVYRGMVERNNKVVETGILTMVIEWSDFMIYNQGDYRFKVCILSPGKV
jgi:hypothetical protein